ncbi:glutathione S-transferase family protein [Sesbania bispinosa]|nr:glutathione S-transferase family protein [Sesbania bispinosa]
MAGTLQNMWCTWKDTKGNGYEFKQSLSMAKRVTHGEVIDNTPGTSGGVAQPDRKARRPANQEAGWPDRRLEGRIGRLEGQPTRSRRSDRKAGRPVDQELELILG